MRKGKRKHRVRIINVNGKRNRTKAKQQILSEIQNEDYSRDIYCIVALIILAISVLLSANSSMVVPGTNWHIYHEKISGIFNRINSNHKSNSRILKSSNYMNLIKKAEQYQDLYGAWSFANNNTYGHWAQQVGESYVSYMKGKKFDDPESKTLEFAACQTGKPVARYFHASIILDIVSSAEEDVTGGNVFGSLRPRSILLINGGSNGLQRNDTWIFINGVIDGVSIPDSKNSSKITYNPIDGSSCNDCPNLNNPEENDKLCNSKDQRLQCNTCNQWHQVKIGIKSRSELECKIFKTWCPMHSPTLHWKILSESSATLFRAQHKLVSIRSSDISYGKEGTIFTFGGLDTAIGATKQLWYMSRLPYPRKSSLSSKSYKDDLTADWYCAKVHGHQESASTFETSIYRTHPLACNTNVTEKINILKGTIDSGIMSPHSRCNWQLGYPSDLANMPNLHVISFTFDRLDVSGSDMNTCTNYVEIHNIPVNGSTRTSIFRGCDLDIIENNFFTSTPGGKLEISLVFDSVCPVHSGLSGTYEVIDVSKSCNSTCETILPCLRVCNGNGICQYGKCHCNLGYRGENCETKCGIHEKCSNGHESISFFPDARSGHSMVSVYRKTTSQVTLYESSGTYPSDCNTMSKTVETLMKLNSSELDHRYGFVTNSVNKTIFTFKGATSSDIRIITKTEVLGVTEGLTRVVVFGGFTRKHGISSDVWTMDVQDQLLDDDSSSYNLCPDINNCTNINLTFCNTNIAKRHPKFPILSRWNKWTKQTVSGTDVQGDAIGARYEHSTIIIRSPDLNSIHVPAVAHSHDKMIVFGGRGEGMLYNDVWSLNIPTKMEGDNSWSWEFIETSVRVSASITLIDDIYGNMQIKTTKPVTARLNQTIELTGCNNDFLNGKWKIISVTNKFIFNVNLTMKKEKEKFINTRYRYVNTEVGAIYRGTLILGSGPSPRRGHAATLYTNQSNSMSYMIVYGGRSSSHIMNDVWVLNVFNNSDGYAWKQLFKDGAKGSWAQPYGSSNFMGWGGIHMQIQAESRMPERFGHSIHMVTSSIDHSNSYTLSALAYGGTGNKALSNSFSEDKSGGHQGGRNSDLMYVCPDVDMACAHPIFKGTGVSNNRLTIISFLISSILVALLA